MGEVGPTLDAGEGKRKEDAQLRVSTASSMTTLRQRSSPALTRRRASLIERLEAARVAAILHCTPVLWRWSIVPHGGSVFSVNRDDAVAEGQAIINACPLTAYSRKRRTIREIGPPGG